MAVPNDNPISIGMWNVAAAADPRKITAFNRPPSEITRDQLRQLYVLLYPFIAADFVHRTDMSQWVTQMGSEFDTILSTYYQDMIQWVKTNHDTHQHIGNNGAPTSPAFSVSPFSEPPELKRWSTHIEDAQYKNGEQHITTSLLGMLTRDTQADIAISTAYNISLLLAGGDIITPFDVALESAIDNNTLYSTTLGV